MLTPEADGDTRIIDQSSEKDSGAVGDSSKSNQLTQGRLYEVRPSEMNPAASNIVDQSTEKANTERFDCFFIYLQN